MKKSLKPPKIGNLKEKIIECLNTGMYKDTSHAIIRKKQRQISLPDVIYVLRYGRHEKIKDKFEPQYQGWSYAVRGYTIDKKDLRIAIAFDDEEMLIITAIVITQGNK